MADRIADSIHACTGSDVTINEVPNDVIANDVNEAENAAAKNDKEVDKYSPELNEDFRDGLDWDNGIGILPGTVMKFRINEQGEVEMMSELDELESNNDENYNDVTTESVDEESKDDMVDTLGRDVKIETKCAIDEIKTKQDLSLQIKTNMEEKSQKMEIMKDSLVSFTNKPLDSSPVKQEHASTSDVISCAFCGKTGNRKTFCGKFCTRQCVAKNAVRHKTKAAKASLMMRNLEQKRARSYEYGNALSLATDNEPGDLKIRIRRNLSVVEEDEDYEPSPSKRRSVVTPPPSRIRRDFIWEDYLSSRNAVAAPSENFKNLTGIDPFPVKRNLFELDWILEAVDPLHQSMICLVSVSAVIGHRLRLHFVGFPAIYDFWVNSDSPFIFPCGFCERTNRLLVPPCGYTEERFSWKSYAEKHNFHVSPEDAFSSLSFENKTKFKIYDRLEAIDRHHRELVCVASIVDILGDYLLIHFDGWNSCYDYWTLASSNYIRPVGWCKENNQKLSPPLGFNEKKMFEWETYMEENKFQAADPNLFTGNSHQFQVGMKLEAVDQKNCRLIRVASIVEVDEYRVRIHFDGWIDAHDHWMDADSGDLHPINWCFETNHPLQAPVNLNEPVRGDQLRCPVPGCVGLGHVKHDRYESHHSEFGCPYSDQNFHRDPLPDRLIYDKSRSHDDVIVDANNITKTNATVVVKRKRGRPRVNRPPSPFERKCLAEERVKTRSSFSVNNHPKHHHMKARSRRLSSMKAYSPLYEAAIMASLTQRKQQSELSLGWEQHVMSLPGVKGKRASDITSWSADQVSAFVNQLTGRSDCGECFISQEIDGEALLMLTQTDITSVLKLKLGPGVKIYNAILMLKAADRFLP